MCRLVRCTVSRTALCRPIRTRVFAARRCLETFLSMALSPLLLLGFFDHDLLVRVAHALALVRLGTLVRADLGRDLAHLLAVHALDEDLRLRGRLRLHAFRKQV